MTKFVIPVITALTAIGVMTITGLLFSKGEIGGGLCTLVLSVLITLFVINDVRRLIQK